MIGQVGGLISEEEDMKTGTSHLDYPNPAGRPPERKAGSSRWGEGGGEVDELVGWESQRAWTQGPGTMLA